MKLGLQIPYFTWPGGPAELGRRLGEIARAAEEAGYSSIWVMDHYFQIPMIGAAELEMLEAYNEIEKTVLLPMNVAGDGAADQLVARLGQYAGVGVQTAIGALIGVETMKPIEIMGKEVIPQAAKL